MPYRLGAHNKELIYHTYEGADAPRDDWRLVLIAMPHRIDPAKIVDALNAAERRRPGVIVPPGAEVRYVIDQPVDYLDGTWYPGRIRTIEHTDLTGTTWYVQLEGVNLMPVKVTDVTRLRRREA